MDGIFNCIRRTVRKREYWAIRIARSCTSKLVKIDRRFSSKFSLLILNSLCTENASLAKLNISRRLSLNGRLKGNAMHNVHSKEMQEINNAIYHVPFLFII